MSRYIPKSSPALARLQQRFEQEERELKEKQERKASQQQKELVEDLPPYTPTEYDKQLDKLLRQEAANGKYMGD